MAITNMSENRFIEIVEAYGASPKRWPDAEREALANFAADNPQLAAKITGGARALDRELETARQPKTDNSLLMARILKEAQVGAMPLAANDRAHTALQAPPWKSLAATLLLTTGIGFGVGQAAASPTDVEQAEAFLRQSAQALGSYETDFAWIKDFS